MLCTFVCHYVLTERAKLERIYQYILESCRSFVKGFDNFSKSCRTSDPSSTTSAFALFASCSKGLMSLIKYIVVGTRRKNDSCTSLRGLFLLLKVVIKLAIFVSGNHVMRKNGMRCTYVFCTSPSFKVYRGRPMVCLSCSEKEIMQSDRTLIVNMLRSAAPQPVRPNVEDYELDYADRFA